MIRYLTPREAIDHGLLHVINEDILWPLGLSVVANPERGALYIRIEGEVLSTTYTPDQHRQRHAAFETFRRERAKALRADAPAADETAGSGRPTAPRKKPATPRRGTRSPASG